MTTLSRCWFRFSLRTMFIVVTVICIWLGYQLNWIHKRRDAREWIRAQGGCVSKVYIIALNGGLQLTPPPPWSIRMLGGTGVHTIEIYENDLSPDKRKTIRHDMTALFPEVVDTLFVPTKIVDD